MVAKQLQESYVLGKREAELDIGASKEWDEFNSSGLCNQSGYVLLKVTLDVILLQQS